MCCARAAWEWKSFCQWLPLIVQDDAGVIADPEHRRVREVAIELICMRFIGCAGNRAGGSILLLLLQSLHALIDALLCVFRSLKAPNPREVLKKLEEDISRLFRLFCSLSTFAGTSVTKPKWLDIFNFLT